MNVRRLKPYDKISFKYRTFKNIVSHLRRPYIELTKEDYIYVQTHFKTDLLEHDGKLYTFGKFDGTQGLMPYELSTYEKKKLGITN